MDDPIQKLCEDAANFSAAAFSSVVPLSELESIKIRPGIHPGRLERIREAYQNGKTLPPIRIYRDSHGNMQLDDGNHRLQVARDRGEKNIRVDWV